MRIANFIPALSGGGAERQLQYVAGELTRRGHQLLVAYARPGAQPWQIDGVPLVPFRSSHSWDPRLLTQALSLVRAWKPDVLHTWGVQMDAVGGVTSMVARVPWVLREPTTAVFYGTSMKSKLRCALVRHAASAVIANSQGGADYWAEHAPRVPRHRIANAIDVEAMDAVPIARESDSPSIVFVGRLEASKNVDVLLRAIASLPDVRLVICGDGAQRAALEALSNELALRDRVAFAGHVASPWRSMKGADLFVSLSQYEGSPNAVLEAFAARVPVLLSDIPAHREIADETSAWFTAATPSAAAQSIRDILARREDARARAEEARRRMAQCSIATIADQFERVYDEATRGAR